MKFVVLNGSPKGDISVTMQYIKFIQTNFQEHHIEIINIAQGIKKIETDENTFKEIVDKVNSSDGVIWAFPLYVFTVHSNYQRFIELLFERNALVAFKGKYTFILTTSIHFFDNTAIDYVHSICDDLDMNFVDYFSPKMYDLQQLETRQKLTKCMQNFIETIEGKMPVFRNFDPISYSPVQYIPEGTSAKMDTVGKKIVVVTDSSESSNLKNMVKKFTGLFSSNVELLSIKDFGIKGSCKGCMRCGYNYTCVYEGKDNYASIYNSKLKTADIIVFAGSIKYRFLSSEWKQFLDRAFFNTHTPSLVGKQFGFIISGALNQNQNMRQVLEALVQWQRSNLVGFVTDEYSSCLEIDKRLEVLGTNLVNLSIKNYIKPANFLGIGGMTIFRDSIWGDIRFPFIADHKAYKELKAYDFPQKNMRVRLTNAIMTVMIKIPSVRKEIYNNQILPSMTKSLQKYTEYPERFK